MNYVDKSFMCEWWERTDEDTFRYSYRWYGGTSNITYPFYLFLVSLVYEFRQIFSSGPTVLSSLSRIVCVRSNQPHIHPPTVWSFSTGSRLWLLNLPSDFQRPKKSSILSRWLLWPRTWGYESSLRVEVPPILWLFSDSLVISTKRYQLLLKSIFLDWHSSPFHYFPF